MGQEFQILGFNMFLISSFILKNMIYFQLKKLTANGLFFSFLHPSNHVVKNSAKIPAQATQKKVLMRNDGNSWIIYSSILLMLSINPSFSTLNLSLSLSHPSSSSCPCSPTGPTDRGQNPHIVFESMLSKLNQSSQTLLIEFVFILGQGSNLTSHGWNLGQINRMNFHQKTLI